MKLRRVVVVSAVECGGSSRETLMEAHGAQNLRFENGLVLFEDRDETLAVPLANVRWMNLAPDAKAKK